MATMIPRVQKALEAVLKAIADKAAADKAAALAAQQQQIATLRAVADEGHKKRAAELKKLEEEVQRLPAHQDGIPGKFIGPVLLLTNYHQMNLGCSDQGVFYHHGNKAAWENWTLHSVPGKADTFTMHCGSGYVLQFDEKKDGTPSAHKGVTGSPTQHFQMLQAQGGNFVFRNNNGHFLSQNPEGKIWQSPNQAGWEFFKVTVLSGAPEVSKARIEAEAKFKARKEEESKHGERDQSELGKAIAAAEAQAAAAIAAIDRAAAEKSAAKNALAQQLSAHIEQQLVILGQI